VARLDVTARMVGAACAFLACLSWGISRASRLVDAVRSYGERAGTASTEAQSDFASLMRHLPTLMPAEGAPGTRRKLLISGAWCQGAESNHRHRDFSQVL
jgi:hypothetical protein